MNRKIVKPSKFRRAFDWASDNQPAYATAISLGLIFLSPVVSFGVAHTDGVWTVLLIAAQSFIALSLWVIPFLQKRKAEAAELDARSDVQVAFGDALDPVMELFGRLCDARTHGGEEKLRSQMITLILSTAANFIGPQRSRANFYRLVIASPEHLAWDASCGRSSHKSNFQAGTPDGDYCLEAVRNSTTQFYEDLDETQPPGWNRKERGAYKTFISVSVNSGRTAHGMLTLDSLKAGSLTPVDVQMLQVFGRILGASLSVSRYS